MSYNLNVSGHKDNATDEDVQALRDAAQAFADAAAEAGFSATGNLTTSEGTDMIAPNVPAVLRGQDEAAEADAVGEDDANRDGVE